MDLILWTYTIKRNLNKHYTINLVHVFSIKMILRLNQIKIKTELIHAKIWSSSCSVCTSASSNINHANDSAVGVNCSVSMSTVSIPRPTDWVSSAQSENCRNSDSRSKRRWSKTSWCSKHTSSQDILIQVHRLSPILILNLKGDFQVLKTQRIKIIMKFINIKIIDNNFFSLFTIIFYILKTLDIKIISNQNRFFDFTNFY